MKINENKQVQTPTYNICFVTDKKMFVDAHFLENTS